ncbi:DUF11 domain-containing protein [Erythrobacter sp. EC-HK427]|uniref:DUF11 domain-containing protein n=1 Tax=Erythrobacter sp. EC-HK427 TaxID=2038396 RepID=UPI0018FF0F70|nr:DUF11 domain-containing protein [Erythrobacter sp. EC-HK427]
MFAGSGSTAAAAPTQGPVTVSLRANPDNPTGTTSAAISAPAPTVSLRVLNQQYANSTNFTTNGLMIGGTFVGDPHFSPMNFFGGAQNTHFTSLPSLLPGTGISASVNYAFMLEARTAGLAAAGAPQTGRFYFADIELVFSRPISNTVVHIAGLGGSAGGKEFSVELDYIQASSTGATGVALLSGNGLLTLSGNQINNAYNTASGGTPGNCGALTAACGSVRIQGDAVTRVYFRVYMRSRNAVAWPSGASNGSEGVFIGVSGQTADMVPQLSGLPATIEKGTTYSGLTLTCRNNGPNAASVAQCLPSASEGTVSNIVCNPALPANVSELAGSNQIGCTFDYTMPLIVSSSAINIIGQTGAANDRIGGTVLTATNNQTSTSVTVQNAADLSVTKTNTPGVNGDVDQASDTVNSGAIVTYTIRVTNNGPDAATGATVIDTPGAGLTCNAANPVTIAGSGVPAGSFTVGNLTGAGITLGTLANGQSTTLTYSCEVD